MLLARRKIVQKNGGRKNRTQNRSYSEKDIKVLTEVEHVRLRPGMYIGETLHPTHLLVEVLDNALDECINGYANEIEILIDHDLVTIRDNGRGIPFGTNGKTLEKLCTKLFSGGKFTKQAYKISCGTHGVGLSVVNMLSDFFQVITQRNKKVCTLVCQKGKKEKIKVQKVSDTRSYTQVCFKPDYSIFKNRIFQYDQIFLRILNTVYNYPNICIKVKVNQSSKEDIKWLSYVTKNENDFYIFDANLGKVYFENEFFKNTPYIIKLYYQNQKTAEWVKILFSYNRDNINSRILGFVNTLNINNGTHIQAAIDLIYTMFKKYFSNTLEKEWVEYGLRMICCVSLGHPKFKSQTKDKLVNDLDELKSIFNEAKYLDQFEQQINEYKSEIHSLLDYWKRIHISKNSNIQKVSHRYRKVLSIDTTLSDCIRSGKGTELYIVEGRSAGGTILQCRDPRIHAVLSIRGKIINVLDKKEQLNYEKIIKNQELSNIINALGCGFLDTFNINKLKYEKIIITTDADPDGAHIQALISILFMKLFPEIIKQGRLYIAVLPLYGAIKKDKFIPIYSFDDVSKYPGYSIQRYKGLGEMNPEQLRQCLFSEHRQLLRLTIGKDFDNSVFALLTDINEKRKLLNE